ncbi:MAG: ABC transporter ATP-binding protein [Phycisphaerae bacterium]|jgi:ABC-type lipoprotein export system ATPase subunit|nr:ABC transporter ATP-binding protein [Phycisphaerae bacterium]MDP7286678.1 ABC transporter ATP-binding protein [Phycisphaerae bacterium]
MIVRAYNLAKAYQGPRGLTTALDDANVEIAPGQFVMVMGHSAAGKSTLLGVVGGLLRPSRGQVYIDGLEIWQLDERARANLRAGKIGFVFQNAPVVRSLTVLENVLLPATFLPRGARRAAGRARAMSLIETVGLARKTDAYPHELSGGEKRRVAIASALMNDPPLLLADEPTGDLDAKTETDVMDLLGRLNSEGTTVVMVTHNSDLRRFADRVLRITDGRLSEDVSPAPGRTNEARR